MYRRVRFTAGWAAPNTARTVPEFDQRRELPQMCRARGSPLISLTLRPPNNQGHALRASCGAGRRRQHGADRQIGKFGIGVVDDLVRRFRAAGWTADHVTRSNLPCLVAVAQRTFALHDEKHLFFTAMTVESITLIRLSLRK